MAHGSSDYDSVQAMPLLTKRAVADDVLNVSVKTVERLVAAGELTPVKIMGATRFRRADVDALIERSASRRSGRAHDMPDLAGRRGRAETTAGVGRRDSEA
jgi:excisionase family DNA binding protein